MAQVAAASRTGLVLVADDELTIRDLISEILEDAGFRTLTAADGDEAIRLAREHRPAVIVLDVMMPRMDGYTALTRLRGHPLTAATPVIILTGRADPAFENVSSGVGAVAHVTKPFRAAEFLATVERAIGRGRT
jgi:CheY-like chemotaxis protein